MTSGLPAGTWKGGLVKTSACGKGEESNEEVDREEEGEKDDEEENCEEERGQSKAEFGEWFLPSRGEEDEEVSGGRLQPAVALGGGIQNPESCHASGEAWPIQVRDHNVLRDGRSGSGKTRGSGRWEVN
ncbi:hypothetical protein NDU88_006496 [Pleurodeles waltl]|uniref:Uncharacterized protein n=1 Tax=Pleurodeles waltl TaxID=8319 RepID=A0AAV7MK17_PLEWA|nr:hypothetical protein NDU88_006496 [Pleurodeles waltl]